MEKITMKTAIKPLALAITLSVVSYAQAVGTGTIVSGYGDIGKTGNTVTVNQNSHKMIVNWDNMDVGKAETLNFKQTLNQAVLNKISSNNSTLIQGALNAGGRVFIVNPNGVLISRSATVNVGSLVASSLDVQNDDFNRGLIHFSGKGNGNVRNNGKVTAKETVMLLGGTQVINEGTITTKHGNIDLVAGNNIMLRLPAMGQMFISVDGGSLHALVKNSGMIVSNDGNVTLTAWATDRLTRSVVNNTGTLEAHQIWQLDGGHISLKGSNGTGNVETSGKLDAVAIDIMANNAALRDGAKLTTEEGASIYSTNKDGYVRVGKVDIGGRNNHRGSVLISADNLLSTKLTRNSKFNGDVILTAPYSDVTVSNKVVTDQRTIKSGTGVISADILDAVANNKSSLTLGAFKNDVNYDREINNFNDLTLESATGYVNLNSKVNSKKLIIIAGKGLHQASGAAINADGDIHIKLGSADDIYAPCNYCEWGGQITDVFTQKANIISKGNIYLNSTANIMQNEGVKVAAAGVLSVMADTVTLNGDNSATNVKLYTFGDITQSKKSSITSGNLDLQVMDADLRGINHIKKISTSVRNLNLTNAEDISVDKNSIVNGDLVFNSEHNVDVYDGLKVYGAATINTSRDVDLNGVITVNKALNISADNITTAKKSTDYTDLRANGVTLTAKNDVNLSKVKHFRSQGDLNVNAGHSITFDGFFAVKHNANITAKDTVSFYDTFITLGNRNVHAATVNDQSSSKSQFPQFPSYTGWDYWTY